jgi:hypothetical protein
MSPFALRCKSQQVCDQCKPKFCQKGNNRGWACPYGLNVGEIKENTDCGLCLECTRSCTYNNVAIYKRPFASEIVSRTLSEAWLTLAIVILAIVYSVLYEGHWPVVRDYVNILDKRNWNLFGIFAAIVWTLCLVVTPGIVFLLSLTGRWLSKQKIEMRNVFLSNVGSLLPLGLMLWIAFVIPMLFTNVTFIVQSFSDPFGWGWDFFGTANTPWHQFIPKFIPWIQSALILSGLYLSLKNLNRTWVSANMTEKKLFLMILPMGTIIILIVITMLFFFTN